MSPRPPTTQLLVNILSNLGYYGVSTVVMFVLSPFLNHHLGRDHYEIWTYFVYLTGYLSLSDAGMNAATVKYVADGLARRDREALARVVATSLRFFLTVAGLLAAAAAAVALGGSGPLRTVLALLILNWAVEWTFATFQATLVGAERYELARSVAVGARLVKFAAILYLIGRGHGLRTLALLTVGEVFLRGAVQLVLVRRSLPEIPFAWRAASRAVFRTLWRYSLWIVLGTVAYKLTMMSAPVVARLALPGQKVVVVVDKALTPLVHLEQILWALSQVFVPFAAGRTALNDTTALRQAVLRGSRLTALVALPALLYLVLAGRGFVGAWMFDPVNFPAADVTACHRLLLVLGPVFLLFFVQQTPLAVLVGMGRLRVPTRTNLAGAVVAVAGGAAGARLAGLVGLALGMAVPLLVTYGWLLPRYAARTLGFRPAAFLREVAWPLLRTALVVLPAAVLLVELLQASAPRHWRLPYQALVALALAGTTLPGAWFLGLGAADRRWVQARLPGRRRAG